MTTSTYTEVENPLHKLTPEQLEAIGKEFDDLHDEVKADLGERDSTYIRSMIDLQRKLALLGRVMLLGAPVKPLWIAGTTSLSIAKILENMEIGHNVLHGQWDWMNDPVINSRSWDWDTASTAEAWRHSHNYVHHTYTNVLGKDKDLGYEIMRIDPHQKWHPVYLAQPFYNIVLMCLFEWGVATHDLDFDAIRAGEKGKDEVLQDLKGMGHKARAQIVKDYVAWPALSALATGGAELVKGYRNKPRTRLGRRRWKRNLQADVIEAAGRGYKSALKADLTANFVRNIWSYSIIFCGHFPDQTYVFTKDEYEQETKGGRYVRQLLGAANIDGGPLFHVMSGNLSYQVEHHLYPDMPSSRYGEIAPRVREICERYELPYNTGPFFKQVGSVHRTILRLAFPGGKVRPKPGPYKGDKVKNEGEREAVKAAA
ncbi:MAG: acyl-CoA desaturase [Thermoleophilaceae bacterium]|nr:acyl-CoA desaturase [Thermoleophilaceae bacterium]